MSRLIDADALIKEIAKIEDLRTLSTKTIGEAIDRVPGIEIIHCRDCKWWERKYPGSSYGYCHACKHNFYSGHWEIHIARTYHEDFYCADAELRTEEEEEEDD